VIAAVPFLSSIVALTAAVPAETPLTSPLLLTVAIGVLFVPHATTRPLNGAPLTSSGVAVSCTVPPTGIVATVGLTVTVTVNNASNF